MLACLAAGCGEFVRYEPGSDSEAEVDAGLPAAIPPPPGLRVQADFDHADWDALLRRLVSSDDEGHARFDYATLLDDDEGLDQLERYLSSIAEIDASQLEGGDEQLAFYINAYNASMVRAVLLALASHPGFRPDDDDFAVFGRPDLLVSGVRMSLDQLEHGILRGDFTRGGVLDANSQTLGRMRFLHEALRQAAPLDARLHMALNCGALSCPNLQASAFVGDELDAQLDRAATIFLDDGQKGAGPNGVSALFRPDWFERDFVRSSGSVSAFIERHRTDGVSGVALGSFLNYDWTLNALR